MGSDPAPFFANLFLYFYEREWINSVKKHDLIRARSLCNIFRFIDDLSVFNDDKEFEKNFKDIYPKELELTKENCNNSEATFLDLQIKVLNGKFFVGLFDKRDSFPFHIVRMPYKSSNLPSNIFYSSIGAETLRIARASNNTASFFSSVKPLISRMLKQGANASKLSNVLRKFFNKHQTYFKDKAKDSHDFISLMFQ